MNLSGSRANARDGYAPTTPSRLTASERTAMNLSGSRANARDGYATTMARATTANPLREATGGTARRRLPTPPTTARHVEAPNPRRALPPQISHYAAAPSTQTSATTPADQMQQRSSSSSLASTSTPMMPSPSAQAPRPIRTLMPKLPLLPSPTSVLDAHNEYDDRRRPATTATRLLQTASEASRHSARRRLVLTYTPRAVRPGGTAHPVPGSLEDESRCCVCLDRVASLALRPCAHRLCPQCANALHRRVCPLCRTPIAGTVATLKSIASAAVASNIHSTRVRDQVHNLPPEARLDVLSRITNRRLVYGKVLQALLGGTSPASLDLSYCVNLSAGDADFLVRESTLRSVHTLDLSCCEQITAASLATIFSGCTAALRVLKVTGHTRCGGEGPDGTFAKGAERLREVCGNLTALDMSGCHRLDDDEIAALIRAGKGKLRSLKLSRCHRLKDKSMAALVEKGTLDDDDDNDEEEEDVFDDDEQLRGITLRRTSSGGEVMQLVRPSTARIGDSDVRILPLITLDIRECHHVPSEALLGALPCLGRLKKLRLAGCTSMSLPEIMPGLLELGRLTELDLSRIPDCGDDEMLKMLNDASFSSTLTLLRLSRTDVTDVFIYALAGASSRDTRRVARARELEASTSRRGGAVARAVRTDVVAGAMASSSPRTPRAVLPSTTSGGCGVACASSSSSSSSSGAFDSPACKRPISPPPPLPASPRLSNGNATPRDQEQPPSPPQQVCFPSLNELDVSFCEDISGDAVLVISRCHPSLLRLHCSHCPGVSTRERIMLMGLLSSKASMATVETAGVSWA